MHNLTIHVYTYPQDIPDHTMTLPGNILRLASKLIPGEARQALMDQGIDIDELMRLSDQPDAPGTLVDVEDHVTNERVVVSIE